MSEPSKFSPLAARAVEKHRQHLVALISRPPVATWALIGLIVLVYVALLFRTGGAFSFSPKYAVLHGATWRSRVLEDREFYRLFSAIFVHANLAHLALNGYGLYILGPLLEKFYGWQKYLVIFVVSGLGGTLASVYMNEGASVGASGAIFGIIAGTAVLGIKYRKMLPRQIARRMTRGAVILFVLNIAIGFFIPKIDMAAHLGGAVAGGLITFLMPSDIGLKSPKKWLRYAAAIVAISASCWGLYKLSATAQRCGRSEASLVRCYPEQMLGPPAPSSER